MVSGNSAEKKKQVMTQEIYDLELTRISKVSLLHQIQVFTFCAHNWHTIIFTDWKLFEMYIEMYIQNVLVKELR